MVARLPGNLGMSLFFALCLVGGVLIHRFAAARAMAGRLVLIAVLCACGVFAGWVDHDQYLRTPPGRETPQMLNFLATPLLWLGSVCVLVMVATSRLI